MYTIHSSTETEIKVYDIEGSEKVIDLSYIEYFIWAS